MILHSPKCDVWATRTLVFEFLVCVLFTIFFFQYNGIISTSKFPFHNPLVMKYYNFLAIFSLDYKKCPFAKFC